MVKYHLVKNFLAGHTDSFTARPQRVSTFDIDALMERMLQCGTTLTKTDIMAVLNVMEETIVKITKEGHTVAIPLFQTRFSIFGKFDGPMDVFDHTRHKLKINVSRGTLIRDVQKEIKLEKIDCLAPVINILEVRDSISNTVNRVLTSKGVVEIHGSQIKLVGNEENCGLFFVAADGTTVKASVIIQNKPSILIAMVPELTAGTYKVKVATLYNGHYDLKQVRTFEFEHPLTVHE